MTSQPANANALGDEPLGVPALGEVLVHHRRHPSVVHQALINGATWKQIAELTGLPEHRARVNYRQWADEQHHLWRQYGDVGLDDAAHADAMRQASDVSESEAGRL